ncbi:hypothetical protein PR003_g25842 [Phytophthora rubi]|uniref:Uncharacterized protein n=1 Tax=Phytophthora rubi TaxID=129364 RepID=A0A6A4CET2_9STRA|nr:hypothetical protein PR002_g24987 [Phytophthora rubi]KAE8979161.1 hypothetical protein PR001_g24633 [Phytophthora rubi]KAE9288270.1 hypothetical protein PR003_g25842 [Phytophthora rubi]
MPTPIPPRPTVAPSKSPSPTPRATTVAPVSKPTLSPARTPVKTPRPPPAKATVSSRVALTPCPTVTRAAPKQANPTQGGSIPSNGVGVSAGTNGKSTGVAGVSAVVGGGPQGAGVSGGPGLTKGSTTVSTGKKESNPVSNVGIKDSKSDKAQPLPSLQPLKLHAQARLLLLCPGKLPRPKATKAAFFASEDSDTNRPKL